ncbi:hypothetical protein SEPCBS57363_004817 [Sporothrix epigloea]|uniref:Inner kinetochore subunit AME1 domain-containing protein n=1 Tax=Sporothrix epigloea TaxID=1892477 RepID=A0ABP0DU33_9PEZI
MASSREERMQQRMRGAQRHQLQDASFDLFLSLPESIAVPAESSPSQNTADGPGPAIASPPANDVRTTPSAKRRRLNGGARNVASVGDNDVVRDSPNARLLSGPLDQPVEEEIGESPADAPGSGRRRSVIAVDGAAATSRTAALQQLLSNTDNGWSTGSKTAKNMDIVTSSSPLAARGAKKQPASVRETVSPPRQRSDTSEAAEADELSPELSTIMDVSLTGGRSDLGLASAIDSAVHNARTTEKKSKTKADVGRMLSKLVKPKQGNSADAVDELSSPVLSIILESSPNYLMSSSIAASSSPLARKSTVGTRTALNARSSKTSRLSVESRASDAATPPAATSGRQRSLRTSPSEELDELSPEQSSTMIMPPPVARRAVGRIRRKDSEVPSLSPISRPIRRVLLQPEPSTALTGQPSVPVLPQSNGRSPRLSNISETSANVDVGAEENEEAEEIDALEAAKTIGRKRPQRSSVHSPSPELGSDHRQAESGTQLAAATEAGGKPAAAKRHHRRQLQEQSLSLQNRQRPAKSKKQPAKRNRRRAADDSEAEAEDDGSQDEEGREGSGRAGKTNRRGPPVPIVVQRYSQFGRKTRDARAGSAANSNDEGVSEADEEGDELAAAGADIAFANRSGVNAVDVLAQICEDIVEQKLQALQEKQHEARQQQLQADDGDRNQAAAILKEIAVSRRALESFQQEVRARLLTQAVAVDALHALRKRVSAAHKDKLALRQEILRIRAERDQVALRMDALRAQHQGRVHEAMKTATISATMHDIDLAVEQGSAAPELTATHQKAADLANLELVVRRITAHMSGSSGSLHSGGTLQQITDFNDFLERTATMLEGRRASARAVAV